VLLTKEWRVKMSEKVLIAVRDYTPEHFSSIMATKKKYAEIITSYFSENLEAEKQLQEITNRPDLKLLDFLAFGIQNTFGLAMKPFHIGRKWNLASEIRARIGLPPMIKPKAENNEISPLVIEPVAESLQPVVADLSKPIIPLPPKSVVTKIGSVGVVKSKSVESEIDDIKSRLEQLIKQKP